MVSYCVAGAAAADRLPAVRQPDRLVVLVTAFVGTEPDFRVLRLRPNVMEKRYANLVGDRWRVNRTDSYTNASVRTDIFQLRTSQTSTAMLARDEETRAMATATSAALGTPASGGMSWLERDLHSCEPFAISVRRSGPKSRACCMVGATYRRPNCVIFVTGEQIERIDESSLAGWFAVIASLCPRRRLFTNRSPRCEIGAVRTLVPYA